MYFSDKTNYLTTSDLEMLRRVLDKAGLPVATEHADHEKRDGAARLLIALFEQGVTAESKLSETLQASMEVTSPGVKMAHERLYSGSTSTVSTAGGYRFGRRIERNGTWTIYHVFSGVPAEYAAWKMVGLNVKTADRALRILNAPAGAHAAP